MDWNTRTFFAADENPLISDTAVVTTADIDFWDVMLVVIIIATAFFIVRYIISRNRKK